jgi:hypothetical protein
VIADPVAEYLPEEATDEVRQLLNALEQKMLGGASKRQCEVWAINRGIPQTRFMVFWQMIKDSWQISKRTLRAMSDQRDEIRGKFNYVYAKAIETWESAKGSEDWKAAAIAIKGAIDALHHIAKLDGLEMPAELQITVGNGAITNESRENLSQLVEKMRLLAAKAGGPAITPALSPAKPSNGNGNGHSKDPPGDPFITEGDPFVIVCIRCGQKSTHEPPLTCRCGNTYWRDFNPRTDGPQNE